MYTTLKSLGWLISFCLLLVVAFLSLLHTPYAQPMLNPLVQKLTHQKISFGDIHYSIQSPLHLTLSDVAIETDSELNIQTVDFWLSQHPIQNNKLAFDSIKVDGLSLQKGLPDTQSIDWISIAQFSISNLDLANDDIVLRDAQIQLENWAIQKENSLSFEGDFQFSAKQLYWQGEALDEVLVDGYYTQHYTALHGISLTWRGSTITAQAELKENKLWVIPQFTLRKFNLESSNADIINKPIEWLSQHNFTYQFERIDLLDINIELPQFVVNNLSLSAENVLLPYHLWQQNNANISFNADNLVWNEHTINNPIFSLTLNGQKADISTLSFEIFDGHIQLTGKLSPTSINLNSLSIDQVKWAITNEEASVLTQYVNQLEQVKIAKLDVNNTQLIQLNDQYPYQLSGVNMEGHDLDLLRLEQWGLWDGTLSMSASNASFNYLLSQQLLVEMKTEDGLWTVERALLPLSEGLVGFNGSIHLTQDSQPWLFEAYGDGLPISYLSRFFPNPIPIDGITEFTFNGNGLAVNQDSFNYSFNGELNMTPRDMTTTKTAQELWQYKLGLVPDNERPDTSTITTDSSKKKEAIAQYPIHVDPITVTANRGRISIEPITIIGEGFNYNIEGDYDLVNPEQGEAITSITQECHQIKQKLFSEEVHIINYCQ
ncbi:MULTISPECIES: AsmA family protein [Aliivibrio]|uniref:AsmA family protein n=1 Tax=Aliivibrio finisterrensis TaxID=511998 RepID=A0A4Q5KUT0_9GAMM|nr:MULTISPECIES: AsmA family protein [Aliivibrio]MDD9179784.1 AsmA family protein [Aliivibrio sp. A6]RYU50421.1 AsmA family protein [Aliivibrio finisterrensis]RYU51165.1 AsmA family protein [Aliivibrio finisterrensis]RYU56988.1 AsmA family protein [Aliivibrio finisterrensis]RYU63560.1 AsmA family protein [Aliivibrio finisterrensis]